MSEIQLFISTAIIILFFLWLIWQILDINGSAEKSSEQREARSSQRQEVEKERDELLKNKVPPDIEREMRQFLLRTNFHGEEVSPLAYVGYRVGVTNGLASWDRKRRLKVCFQSEIPTVLASAYGSWGRPATYQRFKSIHQHLEMLADLRRSRMNFERAVSEWEADAEWFRNEFGTFANSLRHSGFRS